MFYFTSLEVKQVTGKNRFKYVPIIFYKILFVHMVIASCSYH